MPSPPQEVAIACSPHGEADHVPDIGPDDTHLQPVLQAFTPGCNGNGTGPSLPASGAPSFNSLMAAHLAQDR